MSNLDDHAIAKNIDAVLVHLARELPQLMKSGENWQVILHGGRSGDVIIEQTRKAIVVKPPLQR